ncbi:MAG TPA: glucodextranase DOMON-like domain-containing protein [Acidimicrobiia bacterium]|nr:glucodextranase DOMON-like domain-containing protein [Acidimicrobiia bacterium]
MKPRLLLLGLFTILSCTQVTESSLPPAPVTVPAPSAGTDPHFYLNLIWHQHQPRYPLLPDGTVSRPWVRVHATKDYYDMAALVAEYPNVKITFNLTPILLLQLEELTEGTKDVYWSITEIPADQLSEEQAAFVTARFFDVNPQIIERFPRFRQLAELRDTAEAFTADDFRDLQVLFNLAWTDPSFLALEPLLTLVEKGRDFSEEDKAVVLAEHRRIVGEVIPLHTRLWDEGRIEVITTPLAHPILPLISDVALATVGDPAAQMPANRFMEIPDADQQVIRGLDEAERLLGRRPVGMWPGEGSVAQLVMSLFSKNGVQWVATGEEVLAKTLGLGSFTRNDDDLVLEAHQLYRPYAAQLNRNDPVPMFFRDGLLSDLIGFEYSGSEANAAADDFMGRLRAIRDSLDVDDAFASGRPYVVSVILDGENAWESYPNDGIDFLRALYEQLDGADWIRTVTPTDYLERFPDVEPAPDIWPGAWFQPNFATWIGEEEESTAWDYLFQVREDLKTEEENPAYEAAFRQMLFAEGSDWFWWYGADQESGDDGYFDAAFRDLLGTVYDELGRERPSFLEVPIIPERPVATLTPTGLSTVTIDGSPDDWGAAPSDGVFSVQFDKTHLYLRGPTGTVYLGAPRGEKSAVTAEGVPLGFGATTVISLGPSCGVGPVLSEFSPIPCRALGDEVEAAVPLVAFGALAPGDLLFLKHDDGAGTLYPAGPLALQVPDISNVAVFLEVIDPLGDDYGPGTYTYPTDAVFTAGSYDLERFTVGTEGEQLVVAFDVVAPIQNPWGSPRNLSVQTFDVYIDTDPGTDNGQRRLIDGRNASVREGTGWEFGITIEGWEPAIYVAGAEGTVEETRPSFDVAVFGDEGRVVARIPLSTFGPGDPASWAYGAVVLSQEGFPSSGVRRVRDVEASAQQFRLGGAPADANHTRIIDVASATAGEQEQLLSDYPGASTLDGLSANDFGLIPLITPQ